MAFLDNPKMLARAIELVEKWHADTMKQVLEDGWKMFFYDDGKQAKSIGYVIDAGADIVQTLTPPPAGDLDFQWLADTYGGRACFNGGIDTVQIRFGSPDEIDKAVAELIETFAPTGRFILGTSDSFTEDTPDEHMWADFVAARKDGKVFASNV